MITETCRNIAYDTQTGILSAECRTEDGKSWPKCWLNINNCLVWSVTGKLLLNAGPRYVGSDNLCLTSFSKDHEKMEVSFKDGTIVEATYSYERKIATTVGGSMWRSLWGMPLWGGEWVSRSVTVDFNSYIENRDGFLTCNVGEYGILSFLKFFWLRTLSLTFPHKK